MVTSLRQWYRKPRSRFNQLLVDIVIFVPLAFIIRTIGFGLYKVPSGSMEKTMFTNESFVSDKFTPWFRPIQRGEIIAFNDPTFHYSSHPLKNWWQRYVWGPTNVTKRVIGIPGDHVVGKIEDGKTAVYLNGEKLDEPYVNEYPLIAMWKHGKPTAQDYYLAQQTGDMGKFAYEYRSYDPSRADNNQPFYTVDRESVISPEMFESGSTLLYPGTPLRANANGSLPDVFDVTLGDDEYWVMGDNRLGSYDSRGWGKLKGNLIHGRILFRIFSYDEYALKKTYPFKGWLFADILFNPINFWKSVRWSRCMQFVS